MWDVIWFLGLPMFAVSVFGSPYSRKHKEDRNYYDSENFDVVYDQRQNGTENYKLTVDGLSLVWSPNSLLAAAALLEPALYGEYPESSVDIILGPDLKPEEPVLGPQLLNEAGNVEKNKTESKLDKVEQSKPEEFVEEPSPPTILVIESSTPPGQKHDTKHESTASDPGSKRKLRLPGLLRPFLTKSFSGSSSIPSK